MRARSAVVGAILLTMGTPASAHRLDEYLQATTISVEKGCVQAQMRLTPGVAVFRRVLATIDTNGDGVISAAEQRAYAERVLGDLSLTLDGDRLPLRLVSWRFAKTSEMKEGRGDIQLDFSADVPHSGHNRRLVLENHHQSRIAAYLVNCLVPGDPDIQVTAQHRNYQQSRYQLDYVQAEAHSVQRSFAERSGFHGWMGAAALLLFAGPALLWRRRTRAANGGLLSGLFLFAMILSALPARAHPLPLSYVDLRLDDKGLEASVEAPAVDLAHDLPHLSEKMLLAPATIQAHRQEIVALLTSRLTLSAFGKTLKPSLEGIVPVPDQKDIRLRLRYVWRESPNKLEIRCRLFPYDPSHQTYVDIYEGQALKREMIFDSRTPQQEYVRGSRQSAASVFRQFLIQGVYHIFTGPDHILFIVGLLLLGGTLKQLLKIVTAFTVAHSVTLCLATLNIFSPPARIIEPTIALSIIFVGVHSMVARKAHPGEKPLPDTRLLFAFGFGFIHGFGFANALRELALPREALAGALFAFNLGVECGQACIVLTVAPLLALLHRKNDRIARRFVTSGSLAVIGAGVFWFVQRVITG